MFFKNRKEAGKKLAEKLVSYKDKKDVVVLGLARGGVVVASEAAKELELSFDVLVTRKVGLPLDREMAVGAIADDFLEGVFNKEIIKEFNLSNEEMNKEIDREKEEMKRRLKLYFKDREMLDIKDKIVILTDDGIATGYTMLAAINAVKKKGAKKIIVAVPVASKDTIGKIENEAGELYCLYIPEIFFSVGGFYEDFDQVEDDEVLKILSANN